MDFQRNELSFQLMVEASPIALVLVNSFGKIAYVNSYSEKLFMYDRNEILGQDLCMLLPERFRTNHPDFLMGYFAKPISRKMGENRALFAQKKNGIEFPVEIGLSPIVTVDGTLALAAIIDVTERKKADEQFKMVVESAPNAIILVNGEGNIVMINHQTEVLFGYHRTELIGEKMEILVPERLKDKHPKLRRVFENEPSTRAMGAGRDLFAVRKDGSEIPIEIGLNPIKKEDGGYVLASIIDITERKKSEQAYKLYTKRIEAKNKELEQFTYIASHDLREPLNSITGLISLIFDSEKDKLDKDVLKKLDFISQSSFRMKDLIKGLMDYARLGKNSELVNIDFNRVLEMVLSDVNSKIRANGAVITTDKLPSLIAYEIEIRLLFQNLISNAIKYRDAESDPKIHISATLNKDEYIFSVKDNGIGIPSDQKDKIFLLFQRLHARNEYEGIGIGLAHCKKILELHNGKIWVESELGTGSVFYFSIPIK